ncbi:MMPL family protein [Mycobacterium kansasii]|uniref:MMPL family protein n=1 Tax=Mycobacterium kansasii TaxID=1768 RepID=A0A1V3WQ85_MYCKA|nr:MMPL family protein [Mycobacterium kansasii]
MSKDLSEGAKWDLLIAGVASLCLIFIVMLILTRAFVAATVIVGTVALSLGASFGLSVLFWQDILGIALHWLVLPMSVIVLLAVGSDYNLLLVSRFKQEIGAGLKTGIIRAMGGTGKVVTNAGLVFAVTMGSMIVSDLRIIGQVGTTIGLGLLFDTLIVRSFMTPSIAALLGRWFWWPLQVRSRPTGTTTGKPCRIGPYRLTGARLRLHLPPRALCQLQGLSASPRGRRAVCRALAAPSGNAMSVFPNPFFYNLCSRLRTFTEYGNVVHRYRTHGMR